MLIKLLRHTTDPEKTCALAGRLCYSSVSIDELDKKLTREKIKDLLSRIVSSGHHSVLEHASFTFAIEGVSRALLAQLTRHRIASFSVQSQRYVKFKDKLEYVVPVSLKKERALMAAFEKAVAQTKEFYDLLMAKGIPAEDARYILPQAASTKIILTMNARELRHFFALRCCNRAQWEIRDMSCRMLALARKAAPLSFRRSGARLRRKRLQRIGTLRQTLEKSEIVLKYIFRRRFDIPSVVLYNFDHQIYSGFCRSGQALSPLKSKNHKKQVKLLRPLCEAEFFVLTKLYICYNMALTTIYSNL